MTRSAAPSGALLKWMTPRTAVAVSLTVAAVAVIWQRDAVRQVEAWTVARISGLLLSSPITALSDRPIVRLPLPPGGRFTGVGLLVTPECTSAWLIAPVLLTAAAMVLGRRLNVPAVLLATMLTGAFMLFVNLVRLTVIVAATHEWGLGTGYKWSHEVYGSLITVGGVALGLLVFVRLVVVLSSQVESVEDA